MDDNSLDQMMIFVYSIFTTIRKSTEEINRDTEVDGSIRFY